MHIYDTHHGKASRTKLCEVDVAEVKSHFGLEILLPASMPMIAVDDDLIE